MSDDLKIRRPLDPKKINIHEKWEVDYWTNKWDVTENELIDAVNAVGVKTTDVADHLGKEA